MNDPIPFDGATDWTRGADGDWHGTIASDWCQGRTAFGGLLVGAAVRAAASLASPSRGLRSMSAGFAAPVRIGDATLSATVLRQGRSLTQIEAAIRQEGTVCTRVVMAFGEDRPTSVPHPGPVAPEGPGPEELPSMPFLEGITPAFTQHFDIRWRTPGIPFTGDTSGTAGGWIRPRHPPRTDAALLLAMMDAWPAPILARATRPAAASSVQWMATLTHPLPAPGWMLYLSHSQHAASGYADHTGQMWSQDGTWVGGCRQLVAEFTG